MPRVTVFSGGGSWNVANPVPEPTWDAVSIGSLQLNQRDRSGPR